jgi:hypothetical protein
MANPLPPGLPPGFWDDYCKRFQEEIGHTQAQLERLESGEARVIYRHHDETQRWIAHFRATDPEVSAHRGCGEKRRVTLMPRGPKGEKRPADVIGNAVHVMRIATGD